MLKGILRWVLVLVSLVAVGPLAAALLNQLRDADGGHAVTLLINGNMAKGLLAGAAVFGAAAVVGLVGSHFLSLNTGLMSAGLVLAWGAWSQGTLEDIVRRADSGKDLTMLGMEGALVAVLAALLGWAMVVAAHRAQATPDNPAAAREPVPASVWGGALVGSALAAGLTVWLLAVTSAHGQTLIAALAAGICAGVAGQLISGAKGVAVNPAIPMLSLAVVALIGPLAAAGVHDGSLVDAVMAGRVLNIARPVSLTWAAGAMIGVPIGLGWAGSMLDKRHHA